MLKYVVLILIIVTSVNAADLVCDVPTDNPTYAKIFQDDVEIEDELEIEDMEVDEDTEIDIVIEEEPEEEVIEEEIFTIVENMPEFPGGTEALFKHLAKNIKYPAMARMQVLKGKFM